MSDNYCVHISGNVYQGRYPESKAEFDKLNNEKWVIFSLVPDAPLFKEAYAHIYMPIDDGFFPGLDWLTLAEATVAMYQLSGLNVYIHCHAGISRSAMVAVAWYMAESNESYDQAIAYVKSKNDKAFPNAHFEKGLREYGEYLEGVAEDEPGTAEL